MVIGLRVTQHIRYLVLIMTSFWSLWSLSGHSQLHPKAEWRGHGAFSVWSQLRKHHNTGDISGHYFSIGGSYIYNRHFFRRTSTQWRFRQSWMGEQWHKQWRSFRWANRTQRDFVETLFPIYYYRQILKSCFLLEVKRHSFARGLPMAV